MTLPALADTAAQAGFVTITTEDRGTWYLGEAVQERDRLLGELGQRFAAKFGQQAAEDELRFWQALVRALQARSMSSGHLRATKAKV